MWDYSYFRGACRSSDSETSPRRYNDRSTIFQRSGPQLLEGKTRSGVRPLEGYTVPQAMPGNQTDEPGVIGFR